MLATAWHRRPAPTRRQVVRVTGPSLPLLRTPPFPAVNPHRTAVSIDSPAMPVAPRAAAESLFAMIGQARVGGAFWNPPAPARHGAIALLAPTSPKQARQMLAIVGVDPARRPILVDPRGISGLPGVERLRGTFDPWSLLTGDIVVLADADDEFAALATIAGVPAHILGDGRFANAGAVAAHLSGTRYRDPFTGEPASIEAIVALLADWRRQIDANRAVSVLAGVTRWKRRRLAQFFWAPRERALAFRSAPAGAIRIARGAGGGIAAWPSRISADFAARVTREGVPLATIEDGFIRSTGLGSALHLPQSIVADHRGCHYDATRPSDLEVLLERHDFTAEQLTQARLLRAAIVAGGIGKYGAARDESVPSRDRGRRLVLVAGQVGDDLSVRLGGAGMGGNAALLARAREAEPNAEIWYRPHPDVDAGHRAGGLSDREALGHADRVVRGGSIAGLLAAVDGVHVLTSLTGFEALLRQRDVIVHGLPFFAGWGLTHDLSRIPRRRRRLTLDELVAGALILYPRYLDPVTGLPCSAEVLVRRLGKQAAPQRNLMTILRAAQGWLVRSSRR